MSRVILRGLKTLTISAAGLGTGFALFARPWNTETVSKEIALAHRQEQLRIMEEIKNTPEFLNRFNDPDFEMKSHSELVPAAHRPFQVIEGIFAGPGKLIVEPLVMFNKKKGELVSFSHLGNEMVGLDGKVHNGVIATLVDEGLCFCGFDKLPSKRGVTAKLELDFVGRAKPDSVVFLNAKVVQAKGRKVVVDGVLETMALKKGEKPEIVANLKCILVEPKWFKYLAWVPLFGG